MAVGQQYYAQVSFFNSLETPVNQPQISNGFEVSTNYNIITVEVKNSTSVQLQIEGCIITKDSQGNLLPDDECQWVPMNTINLSDFSVSDTINSNGVYQISLQGIMKIRANLQAVSGDTQIVGIMEN